MAETVDENKIDENNGPAGKKRVNWRFYLISAAIFAGVCGLIIAVDQITKAIVYGKIFYGSSIVLIPGLLEISHVHNTGAAWGMFNQHTGLLSAVTLLACALLCFLYMQSRKKLFRAALLMVIGGAIGNLIDRIARGYVIDFIRVWIIKYEFPNFNVADSCITIGCVLMIIAVLKSGKTKEDTLFRKESLLGRLVEKERKKTTKERPDD
ncbi:MAG: signal peptidase II [Clostridia bacterium]|nr:signal peptidase II [Clostridia bacterium]